MNIQGNYPGRKDYVSVQNEGKKQHMQKRLLLETFSELYEAFKVDYPAIKLSFAKFCSVRPKWCKLIGSSGSHNVCVYQKHQNFILAALAVDLEYQNLMKLIVCNTENRISMIHRCDSCPDKEALLEFLQNSFTDWNQMIKLFFSSGDPLTEVTLNI